MEKLIKKINWRHIRKSILDEKAVLFIGPGISINHRDLEEKESDFLANLAKNDPKNIQSFHHEDGFLLFTDENKRMEYMYDILDFYERDFSNSILEKIADIPFHAIITVTPDITLNHIFNKKRLRFNHEYYKTKLVKQTENEPSADKPIVYNLLGCVTDSESIIISHYDLFNTIKSIYSDKNMPKVITNLFKEKSTTNIIFLGFDFDKWYFQLILHLLRIDSTPCLKYAAAEREFADVKTLYESHFKINFVSRNIETFVNNLHKQFQKEELRSFHQGFKPRKYFQENIRQLIAESISASQLVSLCQAFFEEVYKEFTPDQKNSTRINLLMEHVAKNNAYEDLLFWLEEEVTPIRFIKNAPYYE